MGEHDVVSSPGCPVDKGYEAKSTLSSLRSVEYVAIKMQSVITWDGYVQ